MPRREGQGIWRPPASTGKGTNPLRAHGVVPLLLALVALASACPNSTPRRKPSVRSARSSPKPATTLLTSIASAPSLSESTKTSWFVGALLWTVLAVTCSLHTPLSPSLFCAIPHPFLLAMWSCFYFEQAGNTRRALALQAASSPSSAYPHRVLYLVSVCTARPLFSLSSAHALGGHDMSPLPAHPRRGGGPCTVRPRRLPSVQQGRPAPRGEEAIRSRSKRVRKKAFDCIPLSFLCRSALAFSFLSQGESTGEPGPPPLAQCDECLLTRTTLAVPDRAMRGLVARHATKDARLAVCKWEAECG